MRTSIRLLPLLLGLLLFGPSVAADETTQAEVATAGAPTETVDGFHRALAGENRDAVLAFLAPDATIFESGGAEMSADEYAHHHLGADMEFSRATERRIVDRQAHISGHAAWVLTRSETHGTFRERPVAVRGVETVVLSHDPESGWRIVHVHWSSRSLEEK